MLDGYNTKYGVLEVASMDDPSGAVPANTGLRTYPYAPLNTRVAYGTCSGPVILGVTILGVEMLVVMLRR